MAWLQVRNGSWRVMFRYKKEQHTFWLSLQINPTTIGTHRQNVSLYDGKTLLAVVHHSIRIFP